MAGTFSQIYIQYVFVVKGRTNLLQKPWRNDVFKNISDIIKTMKQKPIIVNGVEDHIHVLVEQRPTISVSDLANGIKNESSAFINQQNFVKDKFEWHDDYGAFSHALYAIKDVYKEIRNQEAFHEQISFKEEFLNLLKEYEIEYDEGDLFDWEDSTL